MIDHVRKQPESVRTRYFLFSFGISMLFVLTLWAFSAKESFSRIAGSETEANTLKEFRDATESNISPDSLKNIMDTGKTLKDETKNMLDTMNTSEQNMEEVSPSPTEEGVNDKETEKPAEILQKPPQDSSSENKP